MCVSAINMWQPLQATNRRYDLDIPFFRVISVLFSNEKDVTLCYPCVPCFSAHTVTESLLPARAHGTAFCGLWMNHQASPSAQVCGLKWAPDQRHLASGGNDNKLFVWDTANSKSGPMLKFTEHQAAVKAIAWSPHQAGLLASGGGTADRCIRFWNTITAQPLQCVDTGSQVCAPKVHVVGVMCLCAVILCFALNRV